MSSITWLDFSDAERKRALQVVALLARRETRDELGLGVIRDAFAEEMFPGMSTIQRRVRYFLFVPWTFASIEQRAAGRMNALELTRREELRLIEVLLATGEGEGVIGSVARRGLQQVPSMIYWQGLLRWGIRRTKGTREQWARAVARPGSRATDDDGQLVDQDRSWWHAQLPQPPDGWPDSATLALRPVDAAYLRERIRDRCAGSILQTLVQRTHPWQEVSFPWELDAPELNDRQRLILGYAQRFSETMNGAALLYNWELAKAEENEERIEEYTLSLEAWAEQESRGDRHVAPLAGLWPLLADLGSRHSPKTRVFVERWFSLTEDPGRVLTDPSLVECVRNRELDVKGKLARLTFDAARETWRGAAGVDPLSYRWPSAQRQLLDIVQTAPA